jgi:adenylosuccinate lyase
VEGLVVYPERMKQNLDAHKGLFFSEAVMLALVDKGTARQSAYEMVQRSAMQAFEGEGDFRALLGADPDVTARLTPEELDRCFDLQYALRWTGHIIHRALTA